MSIENPGDSSTNEGNNNSDLNPGGTGQDNQNQGAPGEQGGEGGQSSQNDSGAGPDESGWDDKTKAYISSLRKESAKYRNLNKDISNQFESQTEVIGKLKGALGIEDPEQELTPESFQEIATQNEQMSFRNAVLELAVGNGIGGDSLDYFTFLVEQKAGSLGDGEEMTDEDISTIAQKVKFQTGGAGASNTSFDASKQGSGSPNPDTKTGGVSLDSFSQMTTTQKSELYAKDPETYSKMMAEARKHNRLV